SAASTWSSTMSTREDSEDTEREPLGSRYEPVFCARAQLPRALLEKKPPGVPGVQVRRNGQGRRHSRMVPMTGRFEAAIAVPIAQVQSTGAGRSAPVVSEVPNSGHGRPLAPDHRTH